MKHMIWMLSILAAGFSFQAIADDHAADAHDDHADEEQVIHYEGAQPKTKEEAFKVFAEKKAVIAPLFAKEKLSDADLEAVHEATYSLENAVDFLRDLETEANSAKLDVLDEAVQALHYASENHEEEISREWYGKLVAAHTEVKNAF